ncbi:hypothetical protein IFM89_031764 [Coptis chinensis]|uniref:Uncharacterized protein n=1 Tax=Coptis chinensis TaxID=261450 RepID=A0A835H0Z6_9MAGN|nr:hypothetical protein IFM89_031764 [Coptis chinensis]
MRICRSNTSSTEILKAFACATVSFIWNQRNQRTFEHKSQPWQVVCTSLMNSMKVYLQGLFANVILNQDAKLLMDRLKMIMLELEAPFKIAMEMFFLLTQVQEVLGQFYIKNWKPSLMGYLAESYCKKGRS